MSLRSSLVASTLILGIGCQSSWQPDQPQVALSLAQAPACIVPGEPREYRFEVVNEERRDIRLCVVQRLSGKLLYEGDRFAFLLPYSGLSSDACADIIALRPLERRSITISFTAQPGAPSGQATVAFRLLIGASYEDPWFEVRAAAPVVVASATGCCPPPNFAPARDAASVSLPLVVKSARRPRA
jgi:hypothetical protein